MHPPPGNDLNVIWHGLMSVEIEVPFLNVSVGSFGSLLAIVVIVVVI